MGDFNQDSPAIRGQQWQPRTSRLVRLDSPKKGVAQRFKATTNGHHAATHPYFEVLGEKPGLALEILDDSLLTPPVSSTYYFTGSNGGAITTGWETNTNAAVVFGNLNKFSTSTYVRNASALAATATLDLEFRGSAAALTSATRIADVSLVVVAMLTKASGNAQQVTLRGLVNIDDAEYTADDVVYVPRNGKWATYTVAQWPLSPATDVPWVSTSLDDIWTSTDEFGVRLQGKCAAEGFRIAGMALRVETCAENRKSFYYNAGAVGVEATEGWLDTSFTTTNPVATGAFLWAHLYGLDASAQDYLATRLLQDPDHTATTSPNETGEHRKAVITQLVTQGGPISTVTEQPGEMAPVLLDIGSIDTQSVPYANLTYREAAEKIGGVDLTGASGAYVRATDSPALSLTGDREWQALIAADDLTPSTNMVIAAQWVESGNLRASYLELTTNGSLSLWNSSNGTSAGSNYTSSASLTTVNATNGQAIWVGASLDCQVSTNQATATFYVSTAADPNVTASWSTLGTAKTVIGYKAVADTAAGLEVGARDGGTVSMFDGAIYRVRLINGLDRVDVRADGYFYAGSDASNVAKLSDTSVGDAYGNSFVLNGAATFQRYRVTQAVTTAAATGYVGVRFPVLWEGAVAPDSPLTVEVQTATGGASGRGTVVATGYVFPEDVPVTGAKVDALFSATWTNTLNSQVFVVFSSTAKPGQGYRIPVQDTRSDKIASGSTIAEIEGASQGGQTDGWGSETGIHQARYDIPVAFISATEGVSGVAASVLAAA